MEQNDGDAAQFSETYAEHLFVWLFSRVDILFSLLLHVIQPTRHHTFTELARVLGAVPLPVAPALGQQ